jgi:hypothetical protein
MVASLTKTILMKFIMLMIATSVEAILTGNRLIKFAKLVSLSTFVMTTSTHTLSEFELSTNVVGETSLLN